MYSLDVLREEPAVEVVAHRVVDEPPRLLLWLASLVLEYHVIIPPAIEMAKRTCSMVELDASTAQCEHQHEMRDRSRIMCEHSMVRAANKVIAARHRLLTAKLLLAEAPAVGSSSGLPCRMELSRSCEARWLERVSACDVTHVPGPTPSQQYKHVLRTAISVSTASRSCQ